MAWLGRHDHRDPAITQVGGSCEVARAPSSGIVTLPKLARACLRKSQKPDEPDPPNDRWIQCLQYGRRIGPAFRVVECLVFGVFGIHTFTADELFRFSQCQTHGRASGRIPNHQEEPTRSLGVVVATSAAPTLNRADSLGK